MAGEGEQYSKVVEKIVFSVRVGFESNFYSLQTM